MTTLEEYYNKFNEDKRLTRRHGQVEYRTTMRYIERYIELIKKEKGLIRSDIKLLDIGAGCGAYSIPLHESGIDVTAVEYVKHNLGILKKKCPDVKAYQGNAVRLKRFEDESFDMILLFGPMYHLFGEEKLQALKEARRLLKKGGYLLVAYVMNEYSILTYGFKERHILESIKAGKVDESFHVRNSLEDLYDYVRLEDIKTLNDEAELTRVQIIAADGPSDYMRREINALSDEEFEEFVRYHFSVCERYELLGASSHIIDVLTR